ncbi:MAG: hypothetical protein ABTQ26_00390 [Azonexus sp.]|jgi:hypothetical protein
MIRQSEDSRSKNGHHGEPVRGKPFCANNQGSFVAKPNYSFEKRQRDLAKKSKQEEKRQQKLANKAAGTNGEPDGEAAETTASGTGSAAAPA